MAKLPSALDIRSREYRPSSPNVRMPAIDYTGIAKGVEAVGQGVSALVRSQEEEEGYEVQRRLLDFKLETEAAQEEYRRTMPPGGTGYTQGWNAEYQKRAKAFVGRDDANIPASMRGKIGVALKSFEAQLGERAMREEWAERDRKTVEDLDTTLGKTRSAVEVNPDRLEEMWAEGKRLVDGSTLSPAAKHTTARKYRETLEEAAATSIAGRVVDAESYARAKEMLAPHRAERVTAKSVSQGITGQWKVFDKATPTAAERRQIRASGGVVVNLDTNWAKGDRPTQPMVVIPDDATPAQRKAADEYAAKVSQLYNEQFGTSLTPKVVTRSQNGRGRNDTIHTEPFSVNDTKAVEFFTGDEGRQAHAEIIRQTFGQIPGVAFSLPHDPTRKGDRGAVGPRGSEVDLARPLLAEITGGPGSADEPAEDYTGPFRSLSVAKRRAIWGQAEAQFDKVKKGVESVIKKQMEVSSDGYLPPAPILDELDRQVKALGDPMIAAQYDTMLRQAQITRQLQKAPPQAIEAQARALRDAAPTEGATPEIAAQIKHVETVGAAVRKHVADDPMTWAHRTGINVPVGSAQAAQGSFRAAQEDTIAPVRIEQLNFAAPDIDSRLVYRMDQAKGVGRYYGQPPQVFTKAEREALGASLRQGGDAMLFTLGTIANAASRAGLEPADVIKEISKDDAPELGVIGQAVVAGADPRILDTAAKAFAWRAKQGEKFISTIDKAQAVPDLAEYADVLATTPTNVDAVRTTANTVYEYEARRQGKETFDAELYRTVVRRLMGETETPDGSRYGGVGDQGRGWFDGKWGSRGFIGNTPKVMVPPQIRQDSFDDMVSAVRMQDFGDRPPLDGTGKPLTISQIRSASWVSIGPGRYALELKRDSDGTRVVATTPDQQPYVLDVRPLLPAIQRRKPEIFRDYDGSQRATE